MGRAVDLNPSLVFLPGGIVGGQEAVPHSRPYMAFLKIKRCFEPVNTCGGFLIRDDMVVTAAHCRVKRRAELNDWVQPIPLPHPWPEVPVGTRCNMSGWGWMQVNPAKSSDVLQDVVLEVMADEVCERNLTKPYDAKSMLCAGDPRGKKATLKGDSGGPLVCDGVPQGIVSWGPSNGASPEVYARVSRFVRWIRTVMKQLTPPDAPGISSRT
uniref:Peptidase S1 domain-containing protein n=1 Tax=Terrapene triunguis TaxID=2587831 RepID=A0A674IL26_9SAUR